MFALLAFTHLWQKHQGLYSQCGGIHPCTAWSAFMLSSNHKHRDSALSKTAIAGVVTYPNASWAQYCSASESKADAIPNQQQLQHVHDHTHTHTHTHSLSLSLLLGKPRMPQYVVLIHVKNRQTHCVRFIFCVPCHSIGHQLVKCNILYTNRFTHLQETCTKTSCVDHLSVHMNFKNLQHWL